MARLMISTAIAGLLALSGAALAQPDNHRRPDNGRAPAADHAQPAPQARGHMNQQPRAAAAPAPQPAAAPQRPGNAMRGPAPNNAMRGPAPNNNAMRGNPGQRRDFSSYQRNFNAPNHFHTPSSYRRPGGWYAHRWTFGEFLPALFWAPDYWISDYYDFGLMPPPPGTVWVRYGADALLIDRISGEIIQVAYSVFY